MPQRRKKYRHEIFDTKKVLKRYHESTKGKPLLGSDDLLVNYRKRKKISTHLEEAPWSYVLGISILYSLGIVVVKLTWFSVFGKPQWLTLDEAPHHFQQSVAEATETEAAIGNSSSIVETSSIRKQLEKMKRQAKSKR